MKVVSVLSGGLDSTILTYKLVESFGAENVFALSFYYGQKQSIELEKAKLTCSKLGIEHRLIDISFLGEVVAPVCANIAGSDVAMPTIQDVLGDPQPPTEVPYRNMLLNTIAFSFAQANGCEQVFTGIQVHDAYGYWDCTQDFLDNMNAISALNRQHEIKLRAPFAHMSKADEIAIGVELGVPFEDSLTCYDPNAAGESCGVCPSCAERIMNFGKAGIIDPAPYSKHIPWDVVMKRNGH
ncbi:queuosine biosynthesis protein [Vibrio phage 1.081.O._10N.286.52.C2]|nr:queuosine biosynthesis protein [Vibrio phage 1.081.O._10N.286.52.C2]